MNEAMLSELRLLAGEVPVGSTAHRQLCPKCGGGRTRELSLSITRVAEAEFKYCCHRASCGYRGGYGGALGGSSELVRASDGSRESAVRVFRGAILRLGEEWLSELHGSYGFREADATRFGWGESADKRLVVRICGPQGVERGIELRAGRSTGAWTGPKSIGYRATPEPWMGWFRPVGLPDGPTVVVEDTLSAAKLAVAGFTGVSLMGTALSPDKAEELCAHGRTVVLALDRDAGALALSLRRRYGFVLGNFKVLLLSKDIKYNTPEEIQKMVKELTS